MTVGEALDTTFHHQTNSPTVCWVPYTPHIVHGIKSAMINTAYQQLANADAIKFPVTSSIQQI